MFCHLAMPEPSHLKMPNIQCISPFQSAGRHARFARMFTSDSSDLYLTIVSEGDGRSDVLFVSAALARLPPDLLFRDCESADSALVTWLANHGPEPRCSRFLRPSA